MSQFLKRTVESFLSHPKETITGLQASLKEKAVTVSEWDIGQLFSECYGHAAFEEFKGRRGEGAGEFIRENFGVNTQAFININKQFAYTAMMDSYESDDYVFSKIIPKIPSGNVKSMQVPGIERIGVKSSGNKTKEGEKYGIAGVSENYIQTPEVEKYGQIVPITKEAIFFDRTGLVVDRCNKVGEWLGYEQEEQAVACVADLGESDVNGRYKYRWGKSNAGFATIDTYGDSSGTHNWDNLAASNGLTDYSNIQTAWERLKAQVDPFTGKRIKLNARHIVAGPSLAFNLAAALAPMLTKAVGGYPVTGNPVRSEYANPINTIVGTLIPVGLDSGLFEAKTTATTTWYMGDLTKAFKYVEWFPMTVDSLGVGSTAEFESDIVLQFKGSRGGTYATFEPRAMIKCTA